MISAVINPAIEDTNTVMPDLIRHPAFVRIALALHLVPGFHRNDPLQGICRFNSSILHKAIRRIQRYAHGEFYGD